MRRRTSRRRLRRTCPRCRQATLTRIEHREGLLGILLTLTRYCVNCQYNDGVVRQIDLDRTFERDAAMWNEPYVLGEVWW